MLYVANAGDDSIAVIDPGTLKLTQSITLAKGAHKGPRRAVVYKGAYYCINAYTNVLRRIVSWSAAVNRTASGGCATKRQKSSRAGHSPFR